MLGVGRENWFECQGDVVDDNNVDDDVDDVDGDDDVNVDVRDDAWLGRGWKLKLGIKQG